MEYCSVLKENELSRHEKTRRNPKDILLSERRQSEKTTYCVITTVGPSGNKRGFLGSKSTLHNTTMTRHCTFVKFHVCVHVLSSFSCVRICNTMDHSRSGSSADGTTLKGNHHVNCGLWVVTIYQCANIHQL